MNPKRRIIAVLLDSPFYLALKLKERYDLVLNLARFCALKGITP